MTDPRKTLARIRKRADAATEGPWEVEHHYNGFSGEHFVSEVHPTVECEGDGGGGILREADAELIAAARTDVPRLVAALEAVLARHAAEHVEGHWLCGHCFGWDSEPVPYPCPTVTAITTALEESHD